LRVASESVDAGDLPDQFGGGDDTEAFLGEQLRCVQRAPRGANKATVLDAAQRMPGSTAAEIRTATGLAASVISREIKTLLKSGGLQEHQLPDWKPTYTAPE
jgi:hypothetical protein